MRKLWSICLVMLCGIVFSTSGYSEVEDDSAVVISTNDFTITEQDFFFYLNERQIESDRRNEVLATQGAVRAIFESLLSIRYFAAKAESNPAIDRNEIDWMADVFRDRLLMNQQLDLEVDSRLSSVDWEAAAYENYLANRDQYKVGEAVRAEHILIRKGARTRDEALQVASEVIAKLDEGGDFHDMVQKYSEDTGSKLQDGGLGFFERGQMVPEFEKAAFALSVPHQISDLVETEYGFHIIRFLEYRAERQQDFSEVKDQILPRVRARRAAAVREDLVNNVRFGRVDLQLEVDTGLLDEIESRYLPTE